MSGAERCGELTNGDLKLLARELASRFRWANETERDAVRESIVLVREEMLRRIADDGDDLPGVREPRRPRPSAGAAAAARREGDASR
jgi:hypothetical protein